MFWFFELLRIKQWYKNLIVFSVILFSGLFLSLSTWKILFLSFISFCLMSSVNYIINDLIDKNKDKLDKIKGKRPIPSGKISVIFAILIGFILFIVSVLIAYFYLNTYFMIILLIFFISTQFYSFWLKNKIFLDIIMIVINFIIRAIAGALAIKVYISGWFVIGFFFMAMFLVFAKRYGESQDGLHKNRKILEYYTPELMKTFLVVFIALLILFYSLYIIQSYDTYWFIGTIPIFTLLLLRYFMLVMENTDLARHMEKVLIRKDMLIGGLFWLALFVFAYLKFNGIIL